MIGERGYERRSENVTDAVAQLEVESGTHNRAAVKRPALASIPATRIAETEGENGND